MTYYCEFQARPVNQLCGECSDNPCGEMRSEQSPTDGAEVLLREARNVITALDAIIKGEISRDWSEHFGKDWNDMGECIAKIDAHLSGKERT